MRSSNREYLPAVDHLRFAAAGLVVLFHAVMYLRADMNPDQPGLQPLWVYSNNPLETLVIEGHTGVTLFMVLSGFILTNGALGREIDYKTFIRNRLLRVGPLYLAVLITAMVVAGDRFSLSGVLQTVFGFATFSGGFTGGALDKVLWTIGVELQFYLLFPFFLRLLNERGPQAIVKFIVLMAVLRTVAALAAVPGADYMQLTYFTLVGRIDQFLIGMLAAYFFPQIRRYVGRLWVVALALTATMGTLFVYNKLHGHMEPHLWRTVWPDVEALVWAAVVVSYVGTARFARGRLSRALSWGGERSYGMYLLHFGLLEALRVRGFLLDVPGGTVVDAVATGLVLVLPPTVAVASLTFAAIEQPFLSLRRRYVVAEPAPAMPVPRAETRPPVPAVEAPRAHVRSAVG